MKQSVMGFFVLGLILGACGFGGSGDKPPPNTTPVRLARPTATVARTSNDIAKLLANPPPPGTVVELDAFYLRQWSRMPDRHPGMSETPIPKLQCPYRFAALTDMPMYGYLQDLTETFPNVPLAAEPYLVAVDPSFTQPQSFPATPSLPYHARLRGRFGDAAFAECDENARIFVVEQVVQVYEQDVPEDVFVINPPGDIFDWARYENAARGFSIAHPPDWTITPLMDPDAFFATAFTSPRFPDSPITLRVFANPNVVDVFDLSSSPLGRLSSYVLLQQGDRFGSKMLTQKLTGEGVSSQTELTKSNFAVFKHQGASYVIGLRYPLGSRASQDLLTIYLAMVQSFRFNSPQGETPIPPIFQELGAGPFLSEDEMWTSAQKQLPPDATLLEARLMSEAAARALKARCPFLKDGHFEGIWVLHVKGTFEQREQFLVQYFDAKDGTSLCGIAFPQDTSPFQ